MVNFGLKISNFTECKEFKKINVPCNRIRCWMRDEIGGSGFDNFHRLYC